MADVTELRTNLDKMQGLLKAAQSEIQKKTFQDIINKLKEQLNEKETKETENKPVIKKELESKEELENKKVAFQGIGLLYGKIVKRYDDNNDYYNIVIKDKSYQVMINNPRVRDYLEADYNPEKNRYITVYPFLKHYPDKNQPPTLRFTVIAANDEKTLDLKVNEFKLFGIWQFIGVSKCPVVSIYRNRTKGDRVYKLKKKFNNENLNKMITKANHIPVLWKDSVVKPFRFNPKLDKDKQSDRYFVQIKAKFLPNREQWGFIELIGNATLELPRFYKPEKLTKTEEKSKTENNTETEESVESV